MAHAAFGATPVRGGTGRNRTRIIVGLTILVVLGGVGVIAYWYASTFPSPAGGPSLMQATCSSVPQTNSTTVEHAAVGGSGSHAYFLIVEEDYPGPFAGLNGSAYVPTTTQWPTLDVQLGQLVSIHVINCAKSEPHGFQISYYDDIQQNGHINLISIPAGQSYDVTFTATRAGTFRIYCGILCSIHPLMQNGALVVS